MLFFYNYANSLIKCIFIIFAFILICFILIFFWFSFATLCIYLLSGFYCQICFVCSKFYFSNPFLFSNLNKCSYKKMQKKLSAIFIFDLKSSSAFSKILPVDHCQASCLHRFSNPNH